jgi:DNA-binding NtrC family response regulator
MVPANDILIVDGSRHPQKLLSEILQDEATASLSPKERNQKRVPSARGQQPALVLLDIWMPDTDGVTLLREWAASGQAHDAGRHDVPGHGTIETAVRGDEDRRVRLPPRSRSACELAGTVARALQDDARGRERGGSRSRRWARALRCTMPSGQSERLSIAAKEPVLLLGEPGTGHEALRAALQQADQPWLALPSGARLATGTRWPCSTRRCDGSSCAPRSEVREGGTERAALS